MKFQAWRELLQHYKSVFKHFWGVRHEMTDKERSADEAEFLPAVLAVQADPPSPAGRWVARILMILVGCILLWSIFGQMDIIVNAPGKVIPSGRTKVISTIETARVTAIHVQNGQKVKAGDVLLELDTRVIDHEQARAEAENHLAMLNAARASALLEAMSSGRPPKLAPVSEVSQDMWQAESEHLKGDWQDYRARKAKLRADIAQYQEMLPLIKKQANDYGILAKTHDVSIHEWQNKQKAYLELSTQLIDAKNELAILTAGVQKDALMMLNDARKVSSGSTQEQLKAKAHSDLLTITAPVDGTIQQLEVNTVGASVPAAQALMQIVPDEDNIEVEAIVENKDIGFIQEGQSVQIKIDAFEYTKYGFVTGKIVNISRDAVSDPTKGKDPEKPDQKGGLQYAVRVALDQKNIYVNGKDMALTAGMSTQTEIKTGQRRVIEYVLSPLVKYTKESLRER